MEICRLCSPEWNEPPPTVATIIFRRYSKVPKNLDPKRIFGPCYIHGASSLIPKNNYQKIVWVAQGLILKNYIFGACTCNELDQNMVFDVRSVHETWTELLQAQAESQSQVCKSLTQPPYNYHRLRSIQKKWITMFSIEWDQTIYTYKH